MTAGRLKIWNDLAQEWEYTPGGGGSQPAPGSVLWKDFLWTEPGAPHADMVATWDIDAGTTILDVVFRPVVNTFADTVTLTMGDTANPTGYFDAAQVGPGGYYNNYDPTNGASAGGQYDVLGNVGADYKLVAYIWDAANANSEGMGVPYDTDDTITLTVGGIDTGGGGGSFIVRVLYIVKQAAATFS